MQRGRWRSLGLTIGALALIVAAALVAGLDLPTLGAALARADYRTIPVMLFFGVLALAVRAARWRLFLDGRLSLATSFHISNIGYLFNNLLPLRAGEAARLLLAAAKTPPVPVMTSISTILLERSIDLVFVFLLLGVALALLPVGDVVSVGGLALAGAAAAGLLLLFISARRPAWVLSLIAWLQARIPALARLPIADQAARFLDGLTSLTAPRALLWALIWTALAWACSTASSAALLFGFFGAVDVPAVLLFSALSTLAVSAATAVAYTPAGVGPYHASVIVALTIAGLTEPEGAPLAYAIVLHGANLLMYIALGLIGLANEGVTLGEMLTRMRASISASPVKEE